MSGRFVRLGTKARGSTLRCVSGEGERAGINGSDAWIKALRALCEEIRVDLRSGYGLDVVVFYLARWCQKELRCDEPDLASLSRSELRSAAERIAGHLERHGTLVERFVQGDPDAMNTVKRAVGESARRRTGAGAHFFTDEATQKISEVLLTGTSPSQAAARLVERVRGPSNEYVFDSPFTNWARTIVINLIKDEWRRATRHARVPVGSRAPDRELVEAARTALPGLLDAIEKLPRTQRRVMALSFSRLDLHPAIRARVRELAPGLFVGDENVLVATDADIAERMDSTPHRVASNRSEARRKLAKQHEAWPFLLDYLLPHRSAQRRKAGDD